MDKNMNVNSLISILFETIEGVKNNDDPKASKCEKCSIENAKAIAGLAKEINSSYRLMFDAAKLCVTADNYSKTADAMSTLGLVTEDDVKKLQ